MQDFAPPPAYHRSDSASWNTQLHSMTQEQVRPKCALVRVQAEEMSRKGTTFVSVGVGVHVWGRVNVLPLLKSMGGEKKWGHFVALSLLN